MQVNDYIKVRTQQYGLVELQAQNLPSLVIGIHRGQYSELLYTCLVTINKYQHLRVYLHTYSFTKVDFKNAMWDVPGNLAPWWFDTLVILYKEQSQNG